MDQFRHIFRFTGGVALLGFALSAAPGCLNERSFPFRHDRIVRVDSAAPAASPRQWLRRTHSEIARLLPSSNPPPLLTDDLTTDDGAPRDVLKYFRKFKSWLHTGWGNFFGLMHTAQVTGDTSAIDAPAPPWPGFEDIWIDVAPGVRITGRMGLAMHEGRPANADCIVILPGLLGDNIRLRTRDLCIGLRDAGFHAMAVEFRGHGQVEGRYPDVPYTYGVLETSDLLVVADWLQDKPYVNRTGMIGYSWSANIALLTAWEDCRAADDPCVAPALHELLPAYDHSRRHYEAGIIAVSPTLDFEHLLDRLETRHAFLENPVLASIQATVASRVSYKDYGPPTGSLRTLIAYEFANWSLNYEGAQDDGLTYLRLLPYKDKPYHAKLTCARMPVLIVHAANDPLAYANEVAEFFADTRNPNVAGVILRGGGHDGFAAYCRDYLYSLYVNFFDPRTGPRAVPNPARPSQLKS